MASFSDTGPYLAWTHQQLQVEILRGTLPQMRIWVLRSATSTFEATRGGVILICNTMNDGDRADRLLFPSLAGNPPGFFVTSINLAYDRTYYLRARENFPLTGTQLSSDNSPWLPVSTGVSPSISPTGYAHAWRRKHGNKNRR